MNDVHMYGRSVVCRTVRVKTWRDRFALAWLTGVVVIALGLM